MSSGDDTVDLAFECGDAIPRTLHFYIDMNTLDNFDFDKPWWYKDFNEGVSINGHLFFTMSSFMTSARGVFQTIFNADVAKDYDINPDDLYEAARSGKWTMDMMGEYAHMAAKDVNGDGVMNEKDQYGILGESYSNWALCLANGFRTVTRDSDNLPVFNFGSENNLAILEKVLKYTSDQNITFYAQNYRGAEDPWLTLSSMKDNGQFLFAVSGIGGGMRNWEFNFGILPNPKFDEEQKSYYHNGSLGNSRQMVIIRSCSDPDITSYIVEAMAYTSYYDVLPIYYDNYLYTKVLRDKESVEMLKIIENSIYYDVGAFFNWGDMRHTIENIKKAEGFASTAAKIEKNVKNAIAQTISKLEEG